MLQLTPQAAELIRTLRESHGDDNGWLRVSSRDASSSGGLSLALEFVASSSSGDQVGESEGVPMCVAGDMADVLDDKVLDVADRPEGRGLILRAA